MQMNLADGQPVASAYPFEPAAEKQVGTSDVDRIVEFYDEAGMDYQHWRRGLNMHLGFYRPGIRMYDRERMLEQMNLEVASRLQINLNKAASLIDLGCGAGSIARTIANKYPSVTVKGVTIVPS